MTSRLAATTLLLIFLPPATAGPFVAAGNEHDGEAVTCDLPVSEHLRNSAGRDGLGLCVFTSIEHAARWANETSLIGFRDFMTRQPGGGWPEKVDEFIPRMAASKGLPAPDYVQHTGGDAEFLKLALKTGRYVCVTYNGRDGTFYSGPIAHMVNLVHLSDRWAAIHDNNFPGKWLWMPPADFLSRWRGSGGGWAVVLLKPGPPPIPVNLPRPREVIGQRVCPPGGCPPAIDPAELAWQSDPSNPGYFYLFKGSKQLGTWHPDGRGYRELRPGGSWASAEPPLPLPAAANGPVNFGLDLKKLSGEARYRLNGRDISRGEAFAAIGRLVDDSRRLRLTVVGDEALRQRVRNDLACDRLQNWKDKLLVQDYPPDHWAVTDVGLVPGVTIQRAPDAAGKSPVVCRIANYSGPDDLVGALRRADPDYHPDRDPGPNADPAKPDDRKSLPAFVWLAAGVVVVLFLLPRKDKR